MTIQQIKNSVQEIYIGLLGRAADEAGLNYWATEIDNGLITIEQVRANIVNEQIEYAQGLGAPGTTRAELVSQLYSTMFNRAPDAEGFEYWVSGGGSTVPADLLVLAFINGASPEDQIILSNRVDIANYYTENAPFNIAEAVEVLQLVDATTVSQGNAALAIDALTFNEGVARALTANVDLGANFAGTAGNDTYSATTTDQLNLQDTINAGDGVDTVQILTTGAMDSLIDVQFAGLRDMEVLTTTVNQVTLSGFADRAGLNQVNLLNNADQSKTVNTTGFDGDLLINGASNIAADTLTVSLADSGDKGAVLGGGQDVAFIDDVPLATDLSLTSDFVGNGLYNDVIIDGPNGDVYLDDEGVTIVADQNNGFAVNDGQVRGNFQTVYLGTASPDWFSNDDSNTPGNVYINSGAGEDALTAVASDSDERHAFVTGSGNDGVYVNSEAFGVEIIDLGSGNDTVYYNGTGLTLNTSTDTANDQLIGGTGRDTLSALSAQLTAIDNTAPNAIQSISEFEALTVTDAEVGTTLVTSEIQAGIDTVNLDSSTWIAASNITFDAGVASTLNLGEDASGTITVTSAGAGSSDQVTIANGTNVNNAFNDQTIIANGVETLVINSNANGENVQQTLSAIDNTGNSVDFVGSNNVVVDSLLADSVDASGLTGASGLYATTTARNVIGSDGLDLFTLTASLGEEAATFNLGQGNDVVTLNATSGSLGSVVLDMEEGDDVLTLSSLGGMAADSTRLRGGAGDDTLIMTAQLATDVTSDPYVGFGAEVSSFETIDIGKSIVWAPTNGSQTTTVDFDGMQGVQTISIDGDCGGRNETATLTLANLAQNQSITVAGVTLTAVGGVATAADLATKIAALNNGQVYAETSATNNIVARGTFSGWTTPDAADGATVLLQSATLENNVTNLDPIESTIVAAPTAPAITQVGAVAVTETSTITFEDLKFGQSITIGGRTVTNTGASVLDRSDQSQVAGTQVDTEYTDLNLTVSADDVAAAFDVDIDASQGATLGNLSIVGGVGQFSGQNVPGEDAVVFTANTPSENVTDLKATISGAPLVLAPTAPDADITQQGQSAISPVTETQTILIDAELIGLGNSFTWGGVTVERLANSEAPLSADLLDVFESVYTAAANNAAGATGATNINGQPNTWGETVGAFRATATTDSIQRPNSGITTWNFAETFGDNQLITITATSSVTNTNVTNITLSGSALTTNNAVTQLSYTEGDDTTLSDQTEVGTITFDAMAAGTSITMLGLTLTALVNKTAAQVASDFLTAYTDAVAGAGTDDGGTPPLDTNKGYGNTWYQNDFIVTNNSVVTRTGTTKWTLSNTDATDAILGFTAGTTADWTDIADGTASGINAYVGNLNTNGGLTADSQINQQNIATTQGVSPGVNVLFSDLVAGQSVTVAGRTVTAVGNATAANIALAISGGTVTEAMNVIVTGALTNWTAAQIVDNPANVVTFSSTILGQDVSTLGLSGDGADPTDPVTVVTVEGVNTGFTFNNVDSGVTVELTDGITQYASSFINVENAANQNDDALTLQLNGSSNISNAGSLTVDNVETITIVTTDSTDGSNPLAQSTLRLIANDATSVFVAGNHGVDFSGSDLDAMTSFNSTAVVGDDEAAGAITLTTTRDGNVNIQLGNGNAVIDTNSATSDKVVTINSTGGDTTVIANSGLSDGDIDVELDRNINAGDFVTLRITDELGNAIGSDFRVTANQDDEGFATQIRNSIALQADNLGIQGTVEVDDDLDDEFDVNYEFEGRYFVSIVDSSFTDGDIDSQDSDGQYATDPGGPFVTDDAFDIGGEFGPGGAQHIITLNGGNNTITVGDQADVITINNALANTINANGGTNTINVEGSGAQTITTAGGIDAITVRGTGSFDISTGDGNDTVTILGSGDGVIYTGIAGNDTVIDGTGNSTIRTGGNDDVINITAGGNDSVQIGLQGGINTIIGFNAGINGGSNTDTLGFANNSSLTDFGNNLLSGDISLSGSNNIYKVVNGSSTLDLSKIIAPTDESAANGELLVANATSAIVLQASSDTSTSFNVYYVYDGNSSNTPIVGITPEATLIGVVSLVDSDFGDLASYHVGLLSDGIA